MKKKRLTITRHNIINKKLKEVKRLMAKIPNIKIDETLADVDKALEKQQKLEGPRHYLGMSQIGDECWRKLFYSFRNAAAKEIPASGLKNIQDGFVQEDIMADRLRMLPYITLHTTDPADTNNQIGYQLLLGHFRGHLDGMIKGIKEAPLTWHVWENKAVNETKFNKLERLKSIDEKKALAKWDEIYFAQAQIYMHCSQTTRHYLNVETPGGRQYMSCRTDYNKAIAESIITKAKVIIFDNWNIPAKHSEKREYYKCKWCDYQVICHDGDIPLVHCKTCRYSEPVRDGKRKCLYKDVLIEETTLHMDTCKYHIYNPALIPATLIEQQKDCCLYKTESGFQFANVPLTGLPELKDDIDGFYSSKELFERVKNTNNLEKKSIEVMKSVDGEMIDPAKGKKAWDVGFSD